MISLGVSACSSAAGSDGSCGSVSTGSRRTSSCRRSLTRRSRPGARAAGRPVLIGHKQAVETREQLGGDLVAWINYQPLWQDVTRAEPDLLA